MKQWKFGPCFAYSLVTEGYVVVLDAGHRDCQQRHAAVAVTYRGGVESTTCAAATAY